MLLKHELRTLIANWRRSAQQARRATDDLSNLLARGHLHGMSDGLTVAADDLEHALERSNSVPPSDDA